VPFSYFRVSELTGYGAANRAPKSYQVVWDPRGLLRDVAALRNGGVTRLVLSTSVDSAGPESPARVG
jgi:hypothetical protein